ncbi:alpha/beta fold hydrolase [Reyranella sp.]|uniref:alpha/beta fold hydrolase n=1 Tax=Reyranella sp. TaxID=1929291 RepID=UPI003D10A617
MARVSNKGVSIHYRVEGDGPPVVLGHGITSSSDVWYEHGFVAALKPRYRLILIDSRGHGQSDKPHDPQSYTTETCASDIVAILDDLGLKTATYWGYSQGGLYGYALAQHALDRVACFVIGGATAGSERAFPAEAGNEDPLMAAFRAGPEEIIKFYGDWATPLIRERLLANDHAALIASLQGFRLNTKRFSDVVPTIAVPTLIYAGSADPIHDPVRQTASAIPGAQFVSLPGLSHVAANCSSDLVLPHVGPFLAKVLLQPAQSATAS